jgi:hypothetical protein
MPAAPLTERARRIHRVRLWLLRDGWPRLQMFLLVALTGGVGFLVSAGLLKAGWTVIWQRYLAAIAVAYVAFLGLIWAWLQLSRRHLVPETADPLVNALAGWGMQEQQPDAKSLGGYLRKVSGRR